MPSGDLYVSVNLPWTDADCEASPERSGRKGGQVEPVLACCF